MLMLILRFKGNILSNNLEPIIYVFTIFRSFRW